MVLFQIARIVSHRIELEGIVMVLEHLKLIDQVLNNEVLVYLVFIVPSDLSKRFSVQKILYEDIPADSDLRDYPLESIRGIGDKIASQLRVMNINDG